MLRSLAAQLAILHELGAGPASGRAEEVVGHVYGSVGVDCEVAERERRLGLARHVQRDHAVLGEHDRAGAGVECPAAGPVAVDDQRRSVRVPGAAVDIEIIDGDRRAAGIDGCAVVGREVVDGDIADDVDRHVLGSRDALGVGARVDGGSSARRDIRQRFGDRRVAGGVAAAYQRGVGIGVRVAGRRDIGGPRAAPVRAGDQNGRAGAVAAAHPLQVEGRDIRRAIAVLAGAARHVPGSAAILAGEDADLGADIQPGRVGRVDRDCVDRHRRQVVGDVAPGCAAVGGAPESVRPEAGKADVDDVAIVFVDRDAADLRARVAARRDVGVYPAPRAAAVGAHVDAAVLVADPDHIRVAGRDANRIDGVADRGLERRPLRAGRRAGIDIRRTRVVGDPQR